MTLIITAEEVAAVLAISVNDSDVSQAQGIIETVTGVDLTTAGQSTRFAPADYRRLRLAVQWQVAFLDANPGILTSRGNLRSAATNGTSLTFTENPEAFLSPLAKRVLRGLSWRKTVRTRLPVSVRPRESLSQNNVYDVGYQPWRPL